MILFAGAILRILYACGSDVRNVYDDHFQVARIILDEGRWPHPDDNWEAYQPPLYHALSALTYRVFSGHAQTPPTPTATPEQKLSDQGVPCPYPWHVAGRKAIQFLSVASGVGTLLLIWLALRCLFPRVLAAQTAGVALGAFQPRLIYMSGMATNDAMVFLWVSLCVYAALRALPYAQSTTSRLRGRYGWWALAGLGAALAMWTKHSGLAALAVLLVLIPAALLLKDVAARRAQFRGAALAIVLALLGGVWPYVRTFRLTGNPIVTPYTRLPNKLANGLPADVSRISWTSLRIVSLLERPWVHISTVDSFWTSLYGEAWFDFGTAATTNQYKPWIRFLWPRLANRAVEDPLERDRQGLSWDVQVMPATMLWPGRLLIGLGLLPTALTLLGLGALWRRLPSASVGLILVTSAGLGVTTILFQTIRQPFRSSMKATFALTATVALVVFFVAGFVWLTEKRYLGWVRWLVITNLVLLAVVATWHFVDLAFIFPHSSQYFAHRDPL